MFHIIVIGYKDKHNSCKTSIAKYADFIKLPQSGIQRLTATDVCLSWHYFKTPQEPQPTHNDDETKFSFSLADRQSDAITLEFDESTQQISVSKPTGCPEPIYWLAQDQCIIITNDLRYFVINGFTSIDDVGVYGLLQYGTVPSPFTIIKGIRQIPNGYAFRYSLSNQSPEYIKQFYSQIGQSTLDYEASQQLISDALQQKLQAVPDNAVVFFSGGVDSSLLAALLKVLDKKAINLLHFAFSSTDYNSLVAKEIAKRLDYPIHEIPFSIVNPKEILDKLSVDYTFPFGDIAFIAAHELASNALAQYGMGTTIVQGDGADAIFAIQKKYLRDLKYQLYPHWLKSTYSNLFKYCSLWKCGPNSKNPLEQLLRPLSLPAAKCHAVHNTRLSLATIASINQLNDIAFNVPAGTKTALEQAIMQYQVGLLKDASPVDEFSIIDTIQVCAGRTIPKSHEVIRNLGMHSSYPFQSEDLIKLGLSISWDTKCRNNIAKSLLKDILAQYLPSNMVYRSKNAFIPPRQVMFSAPDMVAFMYDVVLTNSNPILDYTNKPIIATMIKRVSHNQPISSSSYQFLATLIHASGWFQQLRNY